MSSARRLQDLQLDGQLYVEVMLAGGVWQDSSVLRGHVEGALLKTSLQGSDEAETE